MKIINDDDKVYIIPTLDKPIIAVFPDRYDIEEAENSFIINETISLEEAIRRVKASDNDSEEFIHTLINDKMWKGMII